MGEKWVKKRRKRYSISPKQLSIFQKMHLIFLKECSIFLFYKKRVVEGLKRGKKKGSKSSKSSKSSVVYLGRSII